LSKRKFDISREILDCASECLNHLACLVGTGPLCKVKKYEEGHVLFVKSHGHQNCPFSIPVRKDCVCTCPVRVEIFRKYKV